MTEINRKLRLEFPSLSRKTEALEYIEEFHKYNSVINGSGGLDRAKNYEEWIQRTIDHSEGKNLGKDRVKASTYFAVIEDRIVGMVNIRHELNEFIRTHGFGHIGYSVRPLERKKGYATKILELSIVFCKGIGMKEIYVGCYTDNIASKKTIEKNGGILVREFKDDKNNDNLEFVIK